jgi:hypothetical protein
MISKPTEDHDVNRLNLNDVDLRNSLAEGVAALAADGVRRRRRQKQGTVDR